MGKSTSCFKIITCGGDSKDHQDIDAHENQSTGDKRGWSFQKRSARQRVLSNSVITETPSSENKQSFETPSLQQTTNSIVSEKNSSTDCINEKHQLSCPEKNSTRDESKDDSQLEESIAIVIQTAIRGRLARIALTKLKSVVKLQASVRGLIVRRHAVGTLRCVQAIVKMQALVRARQSLRQSRQDKLDGNREEDVNTSTTLEKENFNKSKVTYISIEKLLRNRFAHQLLDSTPKTTSINIKCDPLKSDSAWKWLERWMSVSSVDTEEQKKAEMIEEKVGNNAIDPEICNSSNAISIDKNSALPSVGEANLITCDTESLKVQACDVTSSSLRENLELSQCENINVSDMKDDMSMKADTAESSPNQMAQSDEYPDLQCEYDLEKHDIENGQPIMKEILSEQLETDARISVIVLRNTTNPAFLTAQSRFEESSSTVNSGKSTSFSLEESTESHVETVSSLADTAAEAKELDSSEIFSLPGSRLIPFSGSECGTELSISSTLDSPDICDSGTFELQHNGNVLGEDIPDSNKSKNADIEEVDITPAISVSNLSEPILDDEPRKFDVIIRESIISESSTDPGKIEVKADRDVFHQQTELNTETANQACRLSPEASPRSHKTFPESQGTPSSQLSVKSSKNKVDKSGSSLKRKSLSSGKKSHSNNIHNSGSIDSPDHLSKVQKNGKRRNSFGSPRPDSIEQESRDSTSNNSLPRFMQATESARAKVHSNNSPRSSPDIQDRDIYIKKRNSLPGTNGRQGSQAKQSAKGNENKWQR